ncbi:murein transglycosylase A [Propylenella binzhouense]|uniref:peptidoglycan lytic exotransglycosylase n=1 Tax=Propylenella binzhouense TaxID=2555902 RepID=A0A964T2N1_9HYPH|nr:MltA domain-containing protein [Propylenella binzhouense]MYZ46817.1 transglycosylase [Propylenella binzhouense]
MSPSSFDEIPGWADDDHRAAFACFLQSARLIASAAPKTRADGPEGTALAGAARLALAMEKPSPTAARTFFEENFRPARVGADGFVTSYYEPEAEASPVEAPGFGVPLYRRPHDLVRIRAEAMPAGWDPSVEWARLRRDGGFEPYDDRAAIEDGALAGRGLEIAWLADPVDAFFIHVQGSARLRMTDGRVLRVGFDGKSGHPYTSIGRLAVERGLLSAEAAHKDGLEAWLKRNRAAGRLLMRENRSHIFFREIPCLGAAEGPMGAAEVPLTPGRSLAVDRNLRTFHAPIWVAAEGLGDPDAPGRPFRRLMIAQDTGSAILGPARGDLFAGWGPGAGAWAAHVRHPAAMHVLIPRSPHTP